MANGLQLPSTAPVMVLPHCNFFPNTPLPLYIFEPRYRRMLASALEGDRVFCVATAIRPEEADPSLDYDEVAGVYLHGTIGLVRACVQAEDGTSNLLLEGLQRVYFKRWTQEEPFRVAEVEPVPTLEADPEAIALATAKVLALTSVLVERGVRKPPQLDLESGLPQEWIADIVAQFFVTDLEARHGLLALEDLEARLLVLGDLLQAQIASTDPSD